MNNVSNEDLVLLYYGEHEDPGLAARVAASPELTARYEALAAELAPLDRFSPPKRDEDYGAETWLKISPRLAMSQERKPGLLDRLRSALSQPRFSFAGISAVAVVAVLAFLLGRQGVQNEFSPDPGAELQTTAVTSRLDTERLLTSTVSSHLDQIDIMLTEFVNSEQTPGWEAERATDMLVANRLYRQAAASRGDTKLAGFLASLEPLLIEMAYEAYRGSPDTRQRMQREAKDTLLFRVRAVSRQLQNPTLST